MNRRYFFRSLSSAVAGIYIACHVKLATITVESEAIAQKEYVLNPEWVNAPYEFGFFGSCGPDGSIASGEWEPAFFKRGDAASFREASAGRERLIQTSPLRSKTPQLTDLVYQFTSL